MKTVAAVTLMVVFLVSAASGQLGANVVQALTQQVDSTSIIDATVFTGSDMCQKINNAITTVFTNALPLTIDARGFQGQQNCSINPFQPNGTVNPAAYTGRLLLGGVTINTSVQWTMPNQYFWIEGIAMANMAGSTGTVIKATSNFSCAGTGNLSISVTSPSISGCPVVFISGPGQVGGTPYASLGTGIQNLTIDCNSVATCIGAGSYDVQEGGGIDTVGFINQTTACVVFNNAQAPAGSVGISNSFLRNVDCNFLATATSGIGVYVYASDGIAEVSNTTVGVPGSSSTSPIIATCFELNGGRGANINYLHCEHANTAEVIGDTNIVHDVTIRGLTTSATNLGVYIKNTGDFDIKVESVDMEGLPSSGFIGVLSNVADSPGVITGLNSAGTAANLAEFMMTTPGGTMLNTAPPLGFTALRTSEVTLTVQTLSQLVNINEPGLGTIAYCSDCKPSSGTNQCVSGGGGALAVREGTLSTGWYCK